MRKNVDIIITNWNSGVLLQNCIESILRSDLKNINIKIIIIDNASNDNFFQQIPKNQVIKIIRNTKNLGFAKACNQGIENSKSEYLLILNPDTKLFKNTLKKCIMKYEQESDIDILGVKHLDENGNIMVSCSRFPNLKRYIFDILGLSKIFPKLFNPATLMTDWDHKESRFVNHVMGAFMFMKRSILNQLQSFDEDYFVYLEDLDFSYRLKKNGGNVFYDADIEIYHKGCGTSEQVLDKRLFYSLNSRIIYSRKHFGNIASYILIILTLFLEPFTRLIQILARGRFKEINSLLSAYRFLYIYWLKRKKKPRT